jgi:16S rRNA (uracil1498-N3)-methyltransferase
MAAPRFFCRRPLAPDQTIELPPELAHHAMRVLRLKSGTAIVLFDGTGGEYAATLLIDGKKGMAQVGGHHAIEVESPGCITLAQGIAAADKMDWIIEKAVELGVKRLVPIAAKRSVLKLTGERLDKRTLHWNRIAQAASEQCGRNRIMAIEAPQPLQAYLSQVDEAGVSRQPMLFCHPEAERALAEVLRPSMSRLTLVVGPEGGWSDDEIALARRYGLTAIKLGERILRTETAGLAMIAAASALQRWL